MAALTTVQVDLRTLTDYDQRLAAARARAEYELGDASWADTILGAFMHPEQDAAVLRAEKAE